MIDGYNLSIQAKTNANDNASFPQDPYNIGRSRPIVINNQVPPEPTKPFAKEVIQDQSPALMRCDSAQVNNIKEQKFRAEERRKAIKDKQQYYTK